MSPLVRALRHSADHVIALLCSRYFPDMGSYRYLHTERGGAVVSHLTRIREDRSGHPDFGFPWFSEITPRRMLIWVPDIGHGRFLPIPYLIHLPCETCNVSNDFAVDETTREITLAANLRRNVFGDRGLAQHTVRRGERKCMGRVLTDGHYEGEETGHPSAYECQTQRPPATHLQQDQDAERDGRDLNHSCHKQNASLNIYTTETITHFNTEIVHFSTANQMTYSTSEIFLMLGVRKRSSTPAFSSLGGFASSICGTGRSNTARHLAEQATLLKALLKRRGLLLTLAASCRMAITSSFLPIASNHRGDSGRTLQHTGNTFHTFLTSYHRPYGKCEEQHGGQRDGELEVLPVADEVGDAGDGDVAERHGEQVRHPGDGPPLAAHQLHACSTHKHAALQNTLGTVLEKYIQVGATVAERLANRVQSPAGSPNFRKWESCRTMPLFGEFSRGSPVSPTPSFRRRSIFTSITLIGSQDLAFFRAHLEQLRPLQHAANKRLAQFCPTKSKGKVCLQPRTEDKPAHDDADGDEAEAEPEGHVQLQPGAEGHADCDGDLQNKRRHQRVLAAEPARTQKHTYAKPLRQTLTARMAYLSENMPETSPPSATPVRNIISAILGSACLSHTSSHYKHRHTCTYTEINQKAWNRDSNPGSRKGESSESPTLGGTVQGHSPISTQR
ncbi:hypothetical protein PR048_004475 [Dryococelus australis]|uniref:Uncharacterized protein n=1 Tax=Dryococelus australis TaxID=614101 RepID=A0ABQ9I5K3_9NEOP|nr:hypothetical protein PR048_004475 [Dryococelus australis]